MFKVRPNRPSTKIDTLIGAGTRIRGDIVFSGGLRLDGEVTGNVTADTEKSSTLTISEHATVAGEISVSHLIVNGTINGPVRVSGLCELQEHARVAGDVEYASIEIHLGAIIEGRLVHKGQSASKTVELKLASNGN